MGLSRAEWVLYFERILLWKSIERIARKQTPPASYLRSPMKAFLFVFNLKGIEPKKQLKGTVAWDFPSLAFFIVALFRLLNSLNSASNSLSYSNAKFVLRFGPLQGNSFFANTRDLKFGWYIGTGYFCFFSIFEHHIPFKTYEKLSKNCRVILRSGHWFCVSAWLFTSCQSSSELFPMGQLFSN